MTTDTDTDVGEGTARRPLALLTRAASALPLAVAAVGIAAALTLGMAAPEGRTPPVGPDSAGLALPGIGWLDRNPPAGPPDTDTGGRAWPSLPTRGEAAALVDPLPGRLYGRDGLDGITADRVVAVTVDDDPAWVDDHLPRVPVTIELDGDRWHRTWVVLDHDPQAGGWHPAGTTPRR